MRAIARILLRDDRGATSIEYALIASSVAMVVLTAVGTVGEKLSATFRIVAAAV